MKYFFFLFFITINITSFGQTESCDIIEIYSSESVDSKVKAINDNGELVTIQNILIPMKIEIGKYKVSISRKSKNLYKIANQDIYIETRMCLELAFYEDVILIVDSNFGYTRGKIIFE